MSIKFDNYNYQYFTCVGPVGSDLSVSKAVYFAFDDCTISFSQCSEIHMNGSGEVLGLSNEVIFKPFFQIELGVLYQIQNSKWLDFNKKASILESPVQNLFHYIFKTKEGEIWNIISEKVDKHQFVYGGSYTIFQNKIKNWIG